MPVVKGGSVVKSDSCQTKASVPKVTLQTKLTIDNFLVNPVIRERVLQKIVFSNVGPDSDKLNK